MRNRKGFILLTAIFAMIAMTGYAFATNTATINVTSEPIRSKATCDKAGGFTITFDKTTTLADGDQITADLDIGATLCRTIDIVISNGPGADLENVIDTEEVGWDGDNTPTVDAPVTVNNAEGGVSDFVSNGGGVYFWIHGTAGGARITVDVIGETPGASITVGGDDGDTLSISFLDQKTNANYAVDGIYTKDANGEYNVAAIVGDNTLCIDVSRYDDNTVDANCDSKLDKFTFIPSDPQVAHIVTAMNFSMVECKGQTAGYIEIGERVQQQGGGYASCIAFDNESGAGFCPISASYDNHVNNELVIYSVNGSFEQTDYQVRLELLKGTDQNAAPASAQLNDGVYWTNIPVMADGYNANPCDDLNDLAGVQVEGPYTYYTYNGTVTNAEAPNLMDCDVGSNSRASTLLTGASKLSLTATNRYMYINLPPINYDLDEIASGEVVWVKVTVLKAPCGELFTGTLKLGTFGCPQAPVVVSQTLLYPYFTQMDDNPDADSFWDGIAITNIGDAAGTATLTVYEYDGDVATVTTPTVAAHSMYVNLLSLMYGSMTITDNAGGGTLGDSRCYIVVCANFNADGFAMLADGATGESLGYLPRYERMGLCQ